VFLAKMSDEDRTAPASRRNLVLRVEIGGIVAETDSLLLPLEDAGEKEI